MITNDLLARSATAVLVVAGLQRLIVAPAPRQPPTAGGAGDIGADVVADWCADLTTALRAGHSLITAVADTPAHHSDLDALRSLIIDAHSRHRAVADELQVALRRSGEHLAVVIRAITTSDRSGVALTPALERAEQTLRVRANQHREIAVASAQVMLSAGVLTALPFTVLAIAAASSTSVRSVIASTVGYVSIALGASMATAGWWWIRRLTRSSQHRDDDIVDTLDELTIMLSAGMSLRSAVQEMTTHPTPAAAALFTAIHRRCANGDPVADAIEATIAGPHPRDSPTAGDHHRVLAAIASAHRHGAPLGESLGDATRELQRIRDARTRQRIRTLPIRLSAPLAMCILPAFIAIALVPTIAAALAAVRGHTP